MGAMPVPAAMSEMVLAGAKGSGQGEGLEVRGLAKAKGERLEGLAKARRSRGAGV